MSMLFNQKKTFWKAIQMDSGSEHQSRSYTIKCSKKMFASLFCDLLSLDPTWSERDKSRCSKICSLVSRSSFGGLIQLSEQFRRIVVDDSLLAVMDLPSRFDRIPFKGSDELYSDFKTSVSRLLEPPCYELFCQARPLLLRFFTEPIAENALPLNMLACFLTRVNIVRDELKWELATDFRQRDERLKHYSESNTGGNTLVRTMREVVSEWFLGFSFKNLIPHHGPGAAAELPAKEAYLGNKYAKLGMDTLLRHWLNKWVENWRDYYPVEELLIPDFERCSKLVFVPKSVKTMRAINKIPITLMYWQQGVKDQLYEYIRTNRSLHAVIQLEDASVNANYCVLGSRYGTFGTIDLSAASDSVSYDLVKDVFAEVQVLVEAFEALRCEKCAIEETEGELTEFVPNKFAPMGEPLCFPIECLVFASCIEAVLRNAGVPRELTHKYYNVYGDDMVVKSEYCKAVIVALEELGFEVNKEKSFVEPDTVFRESCGVEAYLGTDITPIRIPRSLVHPRDLGLKDKRQLKVHLDRRLKTSRRDVAAAYQSALFLEQLRPIWNRAHALGYTNLRAYMLTIIDPALVWWTENADEGWVTTSASNYRRSDNVGLSRDYQRPYTEFYSFPRVDWKQSRHRVTSRYGYSYYVDDDAYRYFHWFLMAALRSSFSHNQENLSDTSRITVRAPAITFKLIARALHA